MDGLYDDLMARGFSPEQIEYLMELGVLAGKEDILTEQMDMAQQLRGTPGARGRYTGQTYVAAHPLEHMASAAQRVLGELQIHKTRKAQEDLLEEQAERRRAFLEKWGTRPPMSPVAPTPSVLPRF